MTGINGIRALVRWAAAAALAALPLAAAAGNDTRETAVQLTSHDGSVTITGALVAWDPGHYTVQVEAMGLITVEAAKVTCTGPGCPDRGRL